MVNKEYGKNIKLLRIKHDMSQVDAAKIIDTTVKTYRDKESGLRSFSLEEVVALMDSWKESINEVTG